MLLARPAHCCANLRRSACCVAVLCLPLADATSTAVAALLPGQIGLFADPAGVYSEGGTTTDSFEFYVVLNPPQLRMSRCAFTVRRAITTFLATTEVTLPDGVVDSDPSLDGFDLTFPEGCWDAGTPRVLATYRVTSILPGSPPRGSAWLVVDYSSPRIADRPRYVSCDSAVELPLWRAPQWCEYAPPGSLAFDGNACLIGIYSLTCAVDAPIAAGVPAGSVTVPLRAVEGMRLEKHAGQTSMQFTSMTLEVTWDESVATLRAVDPTAATKFWRVEPHVLPGRLNVALDAAGRPAQAVDGTSILALTFDLADRAAWTRLITAVTTVTCLTEACIPDVTFGQLLVGCDKGRITPDGDTDVGDAVVALRMLDATLTPTYGGICAADLDGDLALTEHDVRDVLRMSVGLAPRDSWIVEPPPAASEPAGAASIAVVNLQIDGVWGGHATVQYDAVGLRFLNAVTSEGLLESRLDPAGRLLIAVAGRNDAARTIEISFDVRGAHSPVRLVALQGYDQNGNDRAAAYAFPDGAVDVESSPLVLGPTRLLAATPNPFNPRTMLRFVLARPGPAHLSVHDTAGRLVRSFAQTWMEAGPHELAWDGRDDAGNPAASGVYRLRLVAADGVDQQRSVVLLR